MSQNVNRRTFTWLDLQSLLPVLWECRNVPRVQAIEQPCQAQLWSPGKAWQIVAIQVCLETLREIERHFVRWNSLRDFPVACYLQDPVQMIGPLMVKPELGNPKSLRQWSGTCHLVVRCLFECLPCINLVIREWLRHFGLEFPKVFFLQLSSVPILKTKLHPKPFCTFAGTCRSQQMVKECLGNKKGKVFEIRFSRSMI